MIDGKTQPVRLYSGAFIINQTYASCPPLQFLRELTQNAIEAILRRWKSEGAGSPRVGHVVWDVNETFLEHEQVRKLCITDDGIGMTADEMKDFLNQLARTTGSQSGQGNYGVGAKVSTWPANPNGVLYHSWKNNQGAAIHIWFDDRIDNYGLRPYPNGFGGMDYHVDLDPSYRPALIGRQKLHAHGTRVTLLGKDDDDPTTECPLPNSRVNYYWIVKYLNTHYYRFPDGIEVRARTFRSDGAKAGLERVVGMKALLDKLCTHQGAVVLDGVTARWWVRPSDAAHSTTEAASGEISGSVAAIYQDELYEMRTGRQATIAMQSMGITAGYNQITVYFEPHDTARMTTDIARRGLLINSDGLPWEDWFVQFGEQLPEPIVEVIEEQLSSRTTRDYAAGYKKRLADILPLIQNSRYQRTSKPGKETEEEAPVTTPGKGDGDADPGTGPRPSRGGKKTGKAINELVRRHAENGQPGADWLTKQMPSVKWVYQADGSRVAGDLEDRAGRYIKAQHTIYLNGDFRGYTEFCAMILKSYAPKPGAEAIVREAIEDWCGQQVVESVVAILGTSTTSKHWEDEDTERALSEEAITLLALARWTCIHPIKRGLGQKLGRYDRELASS